MPITKESLAALLNGREYRNEITAQEEAEAKANGLLVIFGASDDLVELRGALHDEAGAYGGAFLRIDAKGFVPDWDSIDHDDEDACADYFARKGSGFEIEAAWAEGDYSWVIKTSAPCALFDIVEEDEKYCRGVVIELAGLAS